MSETDTRNDEKSRQAVEGGNPYVLGFTIERSWAGLPGRVLRFPVRMYLSGELLQKREATIGLTGEERRSFLVDFRMRVLADVLETAPEGFPDFPDKVTITPDGGSPVETTSLAERAYQFFTRRDQGGRLVFALLVEDVMSEYWNRAIPDPIKPASASLQGGQATSTKD